MRGPKSLALCFFVALTFSRASAAAPSAEGEAYFRCEIAQHAYEEESGNDDAIRFAESRFSNPACNEEGINLNPESVSLDSCQAASRCQAMCGTPPLFVRLWEDRVLPSGQSAPGSKEGTSKVVYNCAREVEFLCKCR